MATKPTQEGRLMELFTPMGTAHLLIRKLEVTEGISQLFKMEAQVLVYEDPSQQRMKATVATPDSILGKPVTIVLNQNREENEFRLRSQALNDRIDRGEGLFVQCTRHARTGVAIQQELVALAARSKRGKGVIR